MFSPMFTGNDNATLTLKDFKLEGALGVGGENIQMISTGGIIGDVYTWRSKGAYLNNPGWYNADGTSAADVTIEAGKGVYVCVGRDNVKMVTSGNVKLAPTSIPLAVGYNVVGNATPRDLTLKEIKLTGALGVGADNIQMVSSGGVIGDVYTWRSKGAYLNNPGWYNADGTSAGDVPFKAGQGIYVCVGRAGTLELPSPIVVAE